MPDDVDCAYYPKEMMAFHARRRSTVFAVQGRRWNATPDAVRQFLLPKGDDGMPRPELFDRVCCSKDVMPCHARRLSTVCVAQRRYWHVTPDNVRPCVLPKR